MDGDQLESSEYCREPQQRSQMKHNSNPSNDSKTKIQVNWTVRGGRIAVSGKSVRTEITELQTNFHQRLCKKLFWALFILGNGNLVNARLRSK